MAVGVLGLLAEGAVATGEVPSTSTGSGTTEWQLERGDSTFETELIGGSPAAEGECRA
ncbi:hypothetical protein ACTG9Q_15820 [Actinokineospora sp. 24-640]